MAEGRCSEKNELFERLLLLQKRQVQREKKKKEENAARALGKTALTFTRVGRQRSLF